VPWIGGALVAGFGVLRVFGLLAALLSMSRDYHAILSNSTREANSSLESMDQALLAQLQFGVVAVAVLWAMSTYWFILLVRGLIAVVLVRVHKKKEVAVESADTNVQCHSQVTKMNSSDLRGS